MDFLEITFNCLERIGHAEAIYPLTTEGTVCNALMWPLPLTTPSSCSSNEYLQPKC